MSDSLPSRPLPVGVVSADAISLLDPFVPAGNDTSSAAELSKPGEPITRALQGSSSFQHAWTAAPLIACDVCAIVAALASAGALRFVLTGVSVPITFGNQLIAVVASYLLFAILQGLFPNSGTSPVVELRACVLAVWASFASMIMLNLAVGVLSSSEISIAVAGIVFGTIYVPLSRMLARRFLASRSWWGERTIIVGSGSQAQALYRFYSRATERGLRPIGLVDAASPAVERESKLGGGLPYLGPVSELQRLSKRYHARWVVVAPGGSEPMEMGHVLANASHIRNVLILPSTYQLPSLWADTRECAGVMGVHLRDHLQNPFALGLKRLMDVVLSSVAIAILSPLLLAIIVWVKCKSPGPAFFGHTRIGRHGKRFKAWKFRSMVCDADRVLEECLENDEEMRRQWFDDQKLKDDPRIIPGIGHFLRKTSLDELPQLWNVLKGEMSLVGPRPIVQDEIDRYREMYALYLRVRPGITGLWQVSGRNDTSYEQRVRLDSYYVCNWSIWLDAYLVLRTIRTMLLREGAY
ncbi:MAG: undecaprenyl-phosphate galactose phosphotransferase WbaP [Planctomycetota bacterium]